MKDLSDGGRLRCCWCRVLGQWMVRKVGLRVHCCGVRSVWWVDAMRLEFSASSLEFLSSSSLEWAADGGV